MPRLRDPRTGVVVNVSDGTASRLGWPSADAPSADGTSNDDVHVCDVCGFEAKTSGGLGAHRRTHDS